MLRKVDKSVACCKWCTLVRISEAGSGRCGNNDDGIPSLNLVSWHVDGVNGVGYRSQGVSTMCVGVGAAVGREEEVK